MNAQSSVQSILTPNTMFEESQKVGLDYVLRLDADRLLSPAYTALGKKPKAPTYGGWESQQIQGHSLGHYISALAGFYDSTGSKEAKEKLDYTVKCLKEIQRKDGYLGGIPSTPFDKAFSGTFNVERFSLGDWWVPWYSVHKIYAGLIDAYTLGKNKDALEVVLKMADWAIKGSSKMTEEQFQRMLTCEHGGMLKVYADLYGITGEKKYLEMAERFIHQEIYKPLSKEVDKLQGYHANTQIPKIIGLARLYELTGKSEYRTAVEFFFDTVVNHRSYVIGGNSKGEHFGVEFAEPLENDTCETCNTYNMLELSEHIFQWNKKSNVADFYETALYNHILASQDPKSGAKTYFVSMKPGFFKVYGTFENAFWCCTGTGMENPERYNRFITKDYDGTIYVNLFVPSTFATEDGWKLEISTSFPYEERASVKILSAGKNPRTLKIRSPKWAPRENAGKDGYVEYSSIKEGDSFEVQLPMKLNTRRTRDKSGNFSILYGPIVLAADLGAGKVPVDIVDNQLVYITNPGMKVEPIVADPLSPEKWIKMKDPSSLVFETSAEATDSGKTYELKPFYGIHHARYSTYFNGEMPKEDERTAKYKDITVDAIEPGRQQSEVDHRYKVSGTSSDYIQEVDRSFRQITEKDGSISYKMKFGPSSKIVVTAYGEDSGTATVCVEDAEAGTISIDGTKGKALVDYEFDVPKSVVDSKLKNKKTANLTVKITSTEDKSLKVLELRTVN